MCRKACRSIHEYTLAIVGWLAVLPTFAAEPLWESSLPAPAAWHRLTGIGTLVVGTGDSLLSLDPDSGQLLWRRGDITGSAPYLVREVDDLPLLVVGEFSAEASSQTGPTGVNYITGETAWRAAPSGGRTLGIFPVPARNLVVVFETVGEGMPGGQGVYVRGIQASDGLTLWRTRYRAGASPLTLHRPDDDGTPSSGDDLSGHPAPVVADGVMYVPFDGLAAIDLADGHISWDVSFLTADRRYKRAYPAPVVADDLVFAAGHDGAVYALERSSGRVRWKATEIPSGLVSQLLITTDTVFARIGGNFYSQKERQYLLDKPLGVIAIDRASGARRWEYLAAQDGMTNLVYMDDRRVLAFADGHDIVGLEATQAGKVVESFRVPIEFKRQITATELTTKGFRALSGLFKGGLTGAQRSATAGGSVGHDAPVAIRPQPDGSLLLRGQQHLLMFDPERALIRWSTHYPAPQVSGISVASMAAMSIVSAARNAVSQALDHEATSGQGNWGGLGALASRRSSASADAGRYTYVLTDVEDDGRKGTGIMAVDMSTGAPATRILLDDPAPDYRVDEVLGRLYYFKDHRDVSAFALR
ncbi:MAG: PQQ-like beta-propeller repeat protein [Gammaproteobacteria bacterium]|nr:PQQ-like beta-propeller repeat protein [Gammaproteobacteria bacterium]